MTDDDTPRRKRGRPAKPPGEIVRRPTVALRVDQDLYDLIAEDAQKSGRSLSEEMESKLRLVFSPEARHIMSISIEAAIARENEEYLELLKGVEGLAWAVDAAELYDAAMKSAASEVGWVAGMPVPDAFEEAFSRRISAGVEGLVKELMKRIRTVEVIRNLPAVADNISKLMDENPELRSEVEKRLQAQIVRNRINHGGGNES